MAREEIEAGGELVELHFEQLGALAVRFAQQSGRVAGRADADADNAAGRVRSGCVPRLPACARRRPRGRRRSRLTRALRLVVICVTAAAAVIA